MSNNTRTIISILLGICIGLLTNWASELDFAPQWFKTSGEWIAGAMALAVGLLIWVSLPRNEKSSPKSLRDRLLDKAKAHYQKRTEQKLMKRLPVTLTLKPSTQGTDEAFAEKYFKQEKRDIKPEEWLETFDAHKKLLMIGKPGAGKTILLLDLALQLCQRAEQDDTQPVPVWLNVATWHENIADKEMKQGFLQRFGFNNAPNKALTDTLATKLPFVRWLGATLKHDPIFSLLPDELLSLLQQSKICLMLDGLDETAQAERASFLQALDKFCGEYPNVRYVLTSRVDEYEDVNENASVNAQLEVQPLTWRSIRASLQRAEQKDRPEAKNLIEAVEHNAALKQVVTTPYYLNLAMECYQFRSDVPKWMETQNPELLAAEIQEYFMEKQLGSDKILRHALSWLAAQMQENDWVTFELADLQPTMLGKQKWIYGLIYGLIGGLIVGLIYGLIYGLIVGLIYGLIYGLIVGLIVGLIYGLIFGLIGGLINDNISVEDRQVWSWKSFRLNWKKQLIYGLIYGLIGGLIYGLIYGLIGGLIFGLIYGLIVGLIGGLIEAGMRTESLGSLQKPYTRLKASLWNEYLKYAFISLIAVPIANWVSARYDGETSDFISWLWAMASTPKQWLGFIGIPVVLLISNAFFQHLCLRVALWLAYRFPLRLVTVLECGVAAKLLEQDGGIWRFRHQNLRDAFAKMAADKTA